MAQLKDTVITGSLTVADAAAITGPTQVSDGDLTLYTSSAGDSPSLVFQRGAGAYKGTLTHETLTAARTWTLPDASGTVALTSQIPTVPTKTSDLTNDGDGTSNFATMADIGSLGGGTITKVKTTAGAHTAIDVSSGNAEFNVPTKTSHLTNDSGFITSFTETDPVFTASPAHGITSQNITDWGNAVQGAYVGGATVSKDNDNMLSIPYITPELDGWTYSWADVPATTPSEVKAVLDDRGTVHIHHRDASYGELFFNTFNFSSSFNLIESEVIFNYQGTLYLYNLLGDTANDVWTSTVSVLAQASDIPTVPTNVSAFNNDAGYLTSYTETDPVFSASAASGITSSDITNWNNKTSNTGTVTQVTAGTGLKIGTAASGGNITTTGTINHINSVTAQPTQAVYPIKIDGQGHISAYGSAVTIPSITLNGSSTTSPSFYAPTSAGTSGYVLTSNGSGAPTWQQASSGGTLVQIVRW